MDKSDRKNRLFQGGVIGLIVIVLLIRFLLDNAYRRQIPALPDMKTFSEPLREQITNTYNKARRRPNADRLGQLGMVFHSSSHYDEAARCYRLAIKKNKSEWIWDYYLGYILKETGESGESVEHFRAVLRKNTDAYLARFYVGEGYQNLNQNDKAEAVFRTLLSLQDKPGGTGKATRKNYFPLRTYAGYQMAQIYMNTDRANQAEKILQEIVQDQRSFGPAYRLLGSVYKILGNTSLGEEYIIQAGDLLDYKPPVDTLIDRLSLISRSDTYILKQIDEAERSVYPEWALMLAANALRYMPENHYLISKYSKLLLTLGSGKQAQPYLNKHLSYFREDFNEIKQVGDMLYDKGFYTESTDYFKRALELRPDDADVKASLVLSFLNAGNQQQGLDLLQGELDRTPGDPKLLANAVYIMLAINDQASAGSYLSRLMRVAPASPKTFRLRALIAEHDGNLQVAIAMYESALKGNPGDLVSIQSLDEILRRQKLWNRDILLLKEALKSHPNEPYLLEKLGTLLVACPDTLLRDYRQGLKYAQRAFINKASTPEIMFSAGRSVAEAYAALGDNDSARLYLKHILELAEGQHAPEEFIEELQTRLKQI